MAMLCPGLAPILKQDEGQDGAERGPGNDANEGKEKRQYRPGRGDGHWNGHASRDDEQNKKGGTRRSYHSTRRWDASQTRPLDRCTCGCGWSVRHSTLQRHVWTTGVLMALSKATSTFQCQDFAKQCTRRRLCQRWFVANTNLRRGTPVQAEETMSDKMSAPWLGWCGRRC